MRVPPTDVQLSGARGFLIGHLGDDVTDVELVGEGEWSRCFGFAHRGSEHVVRFGRHVEDFRRDQWASRFASADLPIPQVTEIGEAFGACYAISARAHGTPLEQLDPPAWGATVPAVLTIDGRASPGRHLGHQRLRRVGPEWQCDPRELARLTSLRSPTTLLVTAPMDGGGASPTCHAATGPSGMPAHGCSS